MLEVFFFLFCLLCNGQDWYRPSKFLPYSYRAFKNPPVIGYFRARVKCYRERSYTFHIQRDYARELGQLQTYLRQDKTSVPGEKSFFILLKITVLSHSFLLCKFFPICNRY